MIVCILCQYDNRQQILVAYRVYDFSDDGSPLAHVMQCRAVCQSCYESRRHRVSDDDVEVGDWIVADDDGNVHARVEFTDEDETMIALLED